MNDKDFDNFLAIIHDLASKADIWMSRPSWIEFSDNNACNLRCIMCTHADGVSRLSMSRADAERILDEVLPHAALLMPSSGSEPMLSDIDLMIEMCRKHDVYLDIFTNATLMDGARFREIADRLFRLVISFDSHIPEVYERIRKPAKFSKVVGNIREIVAAAAELEIPLIFIVVLMADNVPHIPQFVDFIADLGGESARAEIRFQRLLYISSQCEGQEVATRYTQEQLQEILYQALDRAKARRIILSSDLDEPLRGQYAPYSHFFRNVSGDVLLRLIETIKKRYPHFCYMATHYLKINPEGSVYPCCRAPGELIMGNALKTSPLDIWNGERYREFRRDMNEGNYPKFCRTCDVLTGNPYFQKS